MKFRALASLALSLLSGPVAAFDPGRASNYASPDLYRPNVDSIIVRGKNSSGEISGMSLAAPSAYGASMLLSDLFKRSQSIRDIAGVDCTGVADSSYPLSVAVLALKGTGTRIDVDGGCKVKLAGAAQVWLSGVTIEGPGSRDTSPAGAYGQQGGTFLLTDKAKSPFVVSEAWGLNGLKFYWPNQTEAAAVANGGNPIAYPALIAPHGVDQVNSFFFERNQVVNAYDIFDLTVAGGGTNANGGGGSGRIGNNQMFALRYYFRLRRLGGETFIYNNQFSFVAGLYQIAVATNLRNYATANAEVFRVEGDGSSTTQSTVSVDGIQVHNNLVFGDAARFIHVKGGRIDISTFSNNSLDAAGEFLNVELGGAVTATSFTGGYAICKNLHNATAIKNCVSFENGAAPGNTPYFNGFKIVEAAGHGYVFSAIGGSLSVVGGSILNIGNATGLTTPRNGITFNAPSGILTVVGTPISTSPTNRALGPAGIEVDNAASSAITGVSLTNFLNPFYYGVTTGSHRLVGSATFGSIGGAAVNGPGAAIVRRAANVWDVGPVDPLITVLSAPASSTAPCQPGQIMADLTYIYTCVAANSWRRAPVGSTW